MVCERGGVGAKGFSPLQVSLVWENPWAREPGALIFQRALFSLLSSALSSGGSPLRIFHLTASIVIITVSESHRSDLDGATSPMKVSHRSGEMEPAFRRGSHPMSG